MTGNDEKDEQIRANSGMNLKKLEKRSSADKGARIVWLGGLYIGFAFMFLGGIWLLSIVGVIALPWYSVFPILLILLGVGIVIFSLWLRGRIVEETRKQKNSRSKD